ncbi:MAG: hypothetical protein R3323_10605, partial [Wenzhouxiangellaceae bacterium]|nr:hypothetical protein [Wenzhouxiangellaceae bacterium]
MRNATIQTLLGRAAVAGALLSAAILAAPNAMACTVANWSTSSGAVVAGDPPGGDADGSIARYSGFCALQTPGGSISYVQDNNPGGIDRIVARFYVL